MTDSTTTKHWQWNETSRAGLDGTASTANHSVTETRGATFSTTYSCDGHSSTSGGSFNFTQTAATGWDNAVGTPPTGSPTAPSYNGPSSSRWDDLIDAILGQAAIAYTTPANRAAATDAALAAFDAFDADENGQNGGAIRAELSDPANNTSPSGPQPPFILPDRNTIFCVPRYRNGEIVGGIGGDIGRPIEHKQILPLTPVEKAMMGHCLGDPLAEAELRFLLTAWKNTSRWEFGSGGFCGAWLDGFCEQLPDRIAKNKGILKVTPMWFPQADPSPGASIALLPIIRDIWGGPGHYAARIVLPDGFQVFLDNNWEGTGGVFTFAAGTEIPIPTRPLRGGIGTVGPDEPGWRIDPDR